MEDHDEVLRRHRERFEEHQSYMQGQKQAIRDISLKRSSTSASGSQPSPTNAAGNADVAVSPSPAQQWGGTSGGRYNAPQQQHRGYSASSGGGGGGRDRSSGGSVGGGGGSYAGMSPLAVHMRSTQWARRKQQKIQELRELKESDGTQECTFAPEIHTYVSPERGSVGRQQRGSPHSGGGGSTDGGDGNGSGFYAAEVVSGMDSFLKRQERARQLKDDKDARLRCNGSGWTGNTTVPEEFNLGHHGAPTPIRSLHQPLPAPGRGNVMDSIHGQGLAGGIGGLGSAQSTEDLAAGGGPKLPPRGLFSSPLLSAVTSSDN